MVINYLNIKGMTITPMETNSPLVIYTYTVLSSPVSG